MQAITTKFIPCTNTKGSRVKAAAQAGSVTLSWDHGIDNNHKAAAMALVKKYGWDHGEWIEGHLPDGSSVWVCDYKDVADRFEVAA